MYVYKNNIFLESKQDADDLYEYLKDYYNRNLLLGIPVEGFNYGYDNIMYSSSEEKFYIAYENKAFRNLHYGESRIFYVPDWAVVLYNFKNQERYKELYDFKLPWKKYVIDKTSGTLLLDGFYKYTKQDKGIGRLDVMDLVLDSDNKMYNLEEMFECQSILDAKTLTFKFNMKDVFNARNIEIISFWRLMQRQSWQKFSVNVYLSIVQMNHFFNNYAFIKVSSYYKWINEAPLTTIYINRALKGKKDYISRFSNLVYVPRSLTNDESIDYLLSLFNKNINFNVDEVNREKGYMFVQSIYGAKFKLVLL